MHAREGDELDMLCDHLAVTVRQHRGDADVGMRAEAFVLKGHGVLAHALRGLGGGGGIHVGGGCGLGERRGAALVYAVDGRRAQGVVRVPGIGDVGPPDVRAGRRDLHRVSGGAEAGICERNGVYAQALAVAGRRKHYLIGGRCGLGFGNGRVGGAHARGGAFGVVLVPDVGRLAPRRIELFGRHGNRLRFKRRVGKYGGKGRFALGFHGGGGDHRFGRRDGLGDHVAAVFTGHGGGHRFVVVAPCVNGRGVAVREGFKDHRMGLRRKYRIFKGRRVGGFARSAAGGGGNHAVNAVNGLRLRDRGIGLIHAGGGAGRMVLAPLIGGRVPVGIQAQDRDRL